MPPGLPEVIKDYLLNSSIHGLRFVADDERHWSERIFWLLSVLMSWYGSYIVIVEAWKAFQNNSISFVMETTYLDWNTTFPAIAVCENDNLERVYAVADEIWTPTHELDLEELLKELTYFKGLTYYTLQYCDRDLPDPLCPLNNFTYYTNLVRSKCEDTIDNCRYNGKNFNCCTYFEPIETDLGRCYIINSIQSIKNRKRKPLNMMNNRKTGRGKLTIRILVPSRVYTLGIEEVPTLTTLESEVFSVPLTPTPDNAYLNYRRHITVRNIDNDPLAVETSPEKRNCRYIDENFLDVYPFYSRSACTVQCRKDSQMRFCNCSDHLIPNTKEENKCTMKGLKCLNEYYSDLSVIRPSWAKRKGLVCDCPPSCTENDITVIKDDKIKWKVLVNSMKYFFGNAEFESAV